MSSEKIIDKRIKITLLVFALWLIAVLAMLFNIGVFNRERYQSIGDGIAVRQYFIPPHRGTIFDANNVPLAQSITYFDLYVNLSTTTAEHRQEIVTRLAPFLPELSTEFENLDDSGRVLACLNIPLIDELLDMIDDDPALSLKQRIERSVYDHPAVRKRVGEVTGTENFLRGASGLEAEYERTLNGTAEIFRVMEDKHGRMITNTFQVLQQGEPGDNVVLPITLEDIIKANPIPPELLADTEATDDNQEVQEDEQGE